MDLLIQFLAGGKMLVDVDSPFIAMKVAPGRWNVGPAEGTSRPRPNKNASECTLYCIVLVYYSRLAVAFVPGTTRYLVWLPWPVDEGPAPVRGRRSTLERRVVCKCLKVFAPFYLVENIIISCVPEA